MIKTLDNQNIMLRHLAESQKHDERLGKRLDDVFSRQEGLGSTILDLITSGITSPGRKTFGSSLRENLIEAVYDSSHRSDSGNIAAAKFEIPEEERVILRKKFISKLHYVGMYEREQTVAAAHQATFRWIFENPETQKQTSDEHLEIPSEPVRTWDDFGAWLQSDQPLYWITGKAGSGKSTLMKYVSMEIPTAANDFSLSSSQTRSRCTEFLLRWAKNQPLVVATFYFWAGTKNSMQTSKQGLYRTLLSQVLEACPEAIPHAAPERWETLCLFHIDTRPLTTLDLQEMLTRAVKYVSLRMKLCFFIDGLDELKGEPKDLKELVDWVRILIDAGPIKICVASRPWVVFEDALDSKPNLLLEHLTYDDIRGFVTSKLHHADSEFKSLQRREPDFVDQLSKEIVRKAAGVFLWVNLVCASLIDGMMAGDRIKDLRKRLDMLPPDLETLYDRVLDNLDPMNMEHAAQYFFLMQACSRTPEALLFSFADDSDEDPEFPFQIEKGLQEGADIQYRVKEMRKRLNSRCRGLIGITKFGSDASATFLRSLTVQYMHRTVKDYMEQESTQQRLLDMLDMSNDRFDPYVRLCSASLAMWKSHVDWEVRDVLESHQKLFDCLRNAASVADENTELMLRLVEELGRSMRTGDKQLVFANIRALGSNSNTFLPLADKGCFGNTFLSLAIKFDVIKYVKLRVEAGCVIASKQPVAPPILCHPTSKPVKKDSWKSFFRIQDRGSAQASNSADQPKGAREEALVPWPLLLDALFSNASPNPAMVSLLLNKGADPNYPTGGAGSQTTIWTEVLAYTIAVNSGQVTAASNSSDSWADILQSMVRHGASIETKTIDRAIRVVAEEYGIPPSQQGVTVTRLQNTFRAQRFTPEGVAPGSAREALRSSSRFSNNVEYNPYHTMQIKQRMRTLL